jgi:ETS translocation variant 6/7
LLDNDKYNPSIIKWLNKEKGIFKIVKPDLVAELWGAQKNRKTDKKMNYEKMARGMRLYRKQYYNLKF